MPYSETLDRMVMRELTTEEKAEAYDRLVALAMRVDVILGRHRSKAVHDSLFIGVVGDKGRWQRGGVDDLLQGLADAEFWSEGDTCSGVSVLYKKELENGERG